MFTLNGQVMNVFKTPKGLNKKTGEEYDSQDKVQIMGSLPVRESDQYRLDMITLTTDQANVFERLKGQHVSVPVGMIGRGKNDVLYFIPKGSKITSDKPETPLKSA